MDNESNAVMRAVIVDDEPLARDSIRIALGQEPGVEIVAECGDAESAIEAIREHDPDLVFLDVQLPGRSGFDVVEHVGVDRMPATIFVTAFDTHALQAFDVRAIDYLLKPFDNERLREAVERVRRQQAHGGGPLRSSLAELVAAMRGANAGGAPVAQYISRFFVRTGDRTVPIRALDVDWVHADGNYVVLYVNKVQHRLRVSLSSLADQLDPRHFARVHRSSIVNLNRIKEVQPWFGGDYVAILQTGEQVRVSRTFAPAVLRPMQ